MNMLIPISEHMNTLQGEGTFAGTPMHFVRLPGCPVGASASQTWKEETHGPQATSSVLPILSNGLTGSKCRTYDGRFFDCDTDFHMHNTVSVDSLIEQTHEKAICLTGGEPLVHQNKDYFWDLFTQAHKNGIRIHIETSGTIELSSDFEMFKPWITLAPKYRVKSQMLERADEVKLLVDEDFNANSMQLKAMLSYVKGQVFVSAINHEKTIDKHNLELCMRVLKDHPDWRLSVQLHKMLGIR